MNFAFVFVRIVDALVYSGDLSLEFPIATEWRSFKLTFALDLGLDVDEYLKFYFPFALHSSGGTQDFYGILYKQFFANTIKSCEVQLPGLWEKAYHYYLNQYLQFLLQCSFEPTNLVLIYEGLITRKIEKYTMI